MAQARLPEEAAIDVLLVRGIETEDSSGVVLTAEDRQYATAAALSEQPLSTEARPRDVAAFLARRAALALDRLIARYPTVERVRTLSRWPVWLSWAIPLGAFVIGAATDALGGERLNILAFPLLALIAWNLAIFLAMAVRAAFRRVGGHTDAQHPLLRSIEWLVRPASARLAGHPTLERAVARYARDWSQAAGLLTRIRARRTFHLGAAMFAIGVLTGMLLRARYAANYTAGWSGTWGGAEAEIAFLLNLILGPASLLTGLALPTVERLRELRGGGENAGDWLILWAVTAGLFVIVPRLILAAVDGARASMLARRVLVPDDFYVRSLLRNALGRTATARVIPYSFEVPADAHERLTRLIQAALGDNTKVRIDPTIAYGGEDEWLERERDSLTGADHILILFNLASTPEAENHGELVKGVGQRLGDGGTTLAVLLDESSFRHKLRGHQSADRRVEERVSAWRAVLAACAVTPTVFSLESADDAESARTFEQALLRSPVPS